MVDDKIVFLMIAVLLVVGIAICFKLAWSDSGWDTGYSSDYGGYSGKCEYCGNTYNLKDYDYIITKMIKS